MHQPHRPAPDGAATELSPDTAPSPAALFSDPLSAVALPLPASRRPARPPLETLTWQAPPAAPGEEAS